MGDINPIFGHYGLGVQCQFGMRQWLSPLRQLSVSAALEEAEAVCWIWTK